MNWEQIQGKWQEYRGQVKQRWGKLTDNDLTVIHGKRDVLAGKLSRATARRRNRSRRTGTERTELERMGSPSQGRLPKVAIDLQAHDDLFERGYALRMIERLKH